MAVDADLEDEVRRHARADALRRAREDSNCTAALREVAVVWDEATTLATFGAAPGYDPGDVGLTVIAVLPQQVSQVALDVTSSLQRWSDAPSTNDGWVIEGASDGGDCTVSSSESASQPRLTVSYVD